MTLEDMQLLIIDDQDTQILILKTILEKAGFKRIEVSQNPTEAAQTFERVRPDLLFLDINMPRLDGFGVMAALKPLIPEGGYFPILVLTADEREETKKRALAEGAKDFLNKPFDATEVVLRCRNLLEARYFHKQLSDRKVQLEAMVAERTRQLEQTQVEMLVRLARASEYRDDKSGEHVWRVSQLSAQLGQEMGLASEQVTLLLRAARLHDVGKIAIPDGILMKPSRLSPEEFEVIKTHTLVGAELLSGGQSTLMKVAETIALTHHERWDGAGYPHGLKGKDIPLEGRIMAVADTFDALTHDRVHQRACGLPEAVRIIQQQSGEQFDPTVVDAFLRLYDRGELTTSAPGAAPVLVAQ